MKILPLLLLLVMSAFAENKVDSVDQVQEKRIAQLEKEVQALKSELKASKEKVVAEESWKEEFLREEDTQEDEF